MLFTNDELKSVYDFEHNPDEIPDDKANIVALGNEIEHIFDELNKIIDDNKAHTKKGEPTTKIEVKIPDNLGNPIIIDEKKFYNSNTAGQKKVAKELYQTRPIPKRLEKLSITPPNKGTDDYKDDYKRYLQILYFFYMAQNVIFQDQNFFLLLDNYRTTELSPVQRAPFGKYSFFILNNVLENDAAYKRYVHRDEWLSKIEWAIVGCLEELFSDDNLDKSESLEISVQNIINSAKGMTVKKFAETNLLDRVAAWAYQYTNVAYATDMIKNLCPENRPFQFPENVFPHDPIWKTNKRIVTPGQKSEDICKFLLNKDCIQFCKQTDTVKNSPADETKGKAYSFVHEFIEYDRTSIRNQTGHSMFVEIDKKGVETITELNVALIVKTFIDISKSKQNLNTKVPKTSIGDRIIKWKDSQNLSRNLSAKAEDLAMRLFVVALKSERMNALYGAESYYIFQRTDLKIYYLTQLIKQAIYETGKPDDWAYRSLEILSALQELKQQY